MLASLLYAFLATTTLQTQNLPSQPVFHIIEEAKAQEIATTTNPQQIMEVFGDKRMVAVLKCESGFKQFNASGSPLMSHTSDVGVAQINKVHWQEAKRLGLDIHNSVEDNLKMAKIIYDKESIKAWVCYKLVIDE